MVVRLVPHHRVGGHLRVLPMGRSVLGVRLEGDPAKPEPEYFRVAFPGGDVDVVRTVAGDYWLHARVDHPNDGGSPERELAGFVDARLDIHGKCAHEAELGDLDNPQLYHLAVLVRRRPR